MDGVVCHILSYDDELKSMGVESDLIKQCNGLNLNEVTSAIEEEYGKCFFKLVDVYSHSGTCVHFTDLEHPTKTDRWDSSLSAVVFIPVAEAVKWQIHGIKTEADITEELLEQEFSYYEDMVNAYLSGEDNYIVTGYEIPKSTLIEGYHNGCLKEFIENYGTEVDGPVVCEYYIDKNENKESKLREINSNVGSSLIYYPDSYSGAILICDDQTQKVEDFLGISPEEKHTKSRSR